MNKETVNSRTKKLINLAQQLRPYVWFEYCTLYDDCIIVRVNEKYSGNASHLIPEYFEGHKIKIML